MLFSLATFKNNCQHLWIVSFCFVSNTTVICIATKVSRYMPKTDGEVILRESSKDKSYVVVV